MKKYSLQKPISLLSIYLLALFIYTYLVVFKLGSNYRAMDIIGFVIYLVAQMSWIFASYILLRSKLNHENAYGKIRYIIYCSAAALGIIVSLSFGPRELFTSNSFVGNVVDSIGVISFLILMFAYVRVCWLNAYMLQIMERTTHLRSSEIFGTFVLFLYWPIGVFFLHKRLINLDAHQAS